jgi:hypothetical protein
MRVRVVVVASFLAAMAMLSGCGDDADETADDTSERTTAPPSDATEATEPDGSASGDCTTAAEGAAPAEARAAFPDNPDVAWAVEGVEEDPEGRALVEVVPTPDEVGYPRFRLVFACDGDPVLLGTYALDGERWVLLFTTDEIGDVELDPTLP